MEPNCQNQPCHELTELQKRFTRFQDDTVKRLAAGDVSMATINTKLNWLIGILSGIGAAAAEYLAAHGCTVYEFSRHEKSGGSASVNHVTADVTDEASVAAAVQSVLDAEGRIDILLNNAGFGISGAAEFTSVEEAKRQLEVNFWGMVRATKAVLPVMRAQRGGRIVNTSSVAAVTPIPFQTYYSVSKAAINSFTMSVGNEVRPYGIRISAVMPGDTRTGFTDARARSFAGDDAYGGRISRSVAKMEKDERGGVSASVVGAALGRAALSKSRKVFCTVGFVYRLVIFLMRLLPSTAANAILGKMYAE